MAAVKELIVYIGRGTSRRKEESWSGELVSSTGES